MKTFLAARSSPLRLFFFKHIKATNKYVSTHKNFQSISTTFIGGEGSPLESLVALLMLAVQPSTCTFITPHWAPTVVEVTRGISTNGAISGSRKKKKMVRILHKISE